MRSETDANSARQSGHASPPLPPPFSDNSHNNSKTAKSANNNNSNSNNSTNTSNPKRCLVCDDVALGYNFDAISCESCKAFFRRNALRSPMAKCLFKVILWD